jgi:hypothetical protein
MAREISSTAQDAAAVTAGSTEKKKTRQCDQKDSPTHLPPAKRQPRSIAAMVLAVCFVRSFVGIVDSILRVS